jgi:hypothetical protein
MKKILVMTSVFIFLNPFLVYAEYNSIELGEAAGAYLASAYYLHELKDTPCQYLPFKKYSSIDSLDSIVRDISSSLNEKDKKVFYSFIESMNFKKKAQDDFVTGYNKLLNKIELDKNTACGMVFGMYLQQYSEDRKKWKVAKKLYSK